MINNRCEECGDYNGCHRFACQSASEDLKEQMFNRDQRALQKRRDFDRAVILAHELIKYKKIWR